MGVIRRRHLAESAITGSIIGAFFEAHNTLGFGFLESVYLAALERELLARGQDVVREVAVPVIYKGIELARQRLDMVVDGRVIVECKSTAVLPSSAQRQLLNYLRATDLHVGLLLHFGPAPRFHRVYAANKRHGIAVADGSVRFESEIKD